MVDEFTLIDNVFRRRARPRGDVLVGIGDDAAVLALPPGHQLVASTDTLVETVHFPPDLPAPDVGHRSLAVNLSDLAAMAAEPRWALLALTLPAPDPAWLQGFADGFFALCDWYGAALVGGDVTRGPLTITVTVLGVAPERACITRAGARPGDRIFVTGTLGDARLGLDLPVPRGADEALLRQRYARPEPRVAAGLALRGLAHAMIDVSDGCLADLGHILVESRVGAEVDLDLLPLSGAALRCAGRDCALAAAAAGGDDYELLFTAAPAQESVIRARLAEIGLHASAIGEVLSAPGLTLRGAPAARALIGEHGYRHF